jgi:predicted DNA-binding transcriptional regulator YafY
LRADRLLSLLMVLQARGRVTARELAAELEVCERTIYRDLDALSAAGVPVYAERGPGGGCALLEGYRTSLTGLTQDEVQALFALSIPAPLAELGLSQGLKSALLKLAAALPAGRRGEEGRVRERIHLDPGGEPAGEEPVPHLRTLQQALWEDRVLELTYRLPFDTVAEWRVEPYGLVSGAGAWFMVCSREGQVRVLRVSRVLDARLSAGHFARPEGFDLAAAWKEWCAACERNRAVYPVKVRVRPELLPTLVQHFGAGARESIAQAGRPDAEGWLTLTLRFEGLEAARGRLLGYGRAVEVVEPRPLRESVKDHAAQIVALYDG